MFVGEAFEMITCTLRMAFAAELREDALLVLRSLVGPVRAQPGCTQTLLMRDEQDDATVTWVSRWDDRADLDRHLRSDHFRRILAVMELAVERPDIVFECSSDLRGLDLIHEVLGGADDPRTPRSTNLESNIPT
jgi:quinol monooxygenase YgiN